jgi:polyphosphate kinase 2
MVRSSRSAILDANQLQYGAAARGDAGREASLQWARRPSPVDRPVEGPKETDMHGRKRTTHADPDEAAQHDGPRRDDTAEERPALGRREYETRLKALHGRLVGLQRAVVAEGLKVCIVFEGRDGAGKGGTIKALTERTSPRVFRVVALPAPSDREKSQMYVQRYVPHFPAAGEIVIFDRSWYNRAGVERVMGFCTEAQVRGFLEATPLVERAMVQSGIVLLKYWLEVSPDEQTRRLQDRIDDPRKTWKLSPMDLASYRRWDDYTKARDEMIAATDTDTAPWYVARSDDKRQLRLDVLSHILDHVPHSPPKSAKPKLPKRRIHEAAPSDHPLRIVPHV